jgi:hypothetical protein
MNICSMASTSQTVAFSCSQLIWAIRVTFSETHPSISFHVPVKQVVNTVKAGQVPDAERKKEPVVVVTSFSLLAGSLLRIC